MGKEEEAQGCESPSAICWVQRLIILRAHGCRGQETIRRTDETSRPCLLRCPRLLLRRRNRRQHPSWTINNVIKIHCRERARTIDSISWLYFFALDESFTLGSLSQLDVIHACILSCYANNQNGTPSMLWPPRSHTDTVGNVSSCRLTRSLYLHDLPSLDTIVPCDRVCDHDSR